MIDIANTFKSAASAVITQSAPAESVWIQVPEIAKLWASQFTRDFPGHVSNLAYAVKANPDPTIIKTLYGIHIKNFEIASLEEAFIVANALQNHDDYALWLHNPLSSARQIETALLEYSVRHFVVTSKEALARIKSIILKNGIPPDQIHLSLRVKVEAGSHAADGAYDHLFASDYNIENHAVPLLIDVAKAGFSHSLYFNISTQTKDRQLFADALGQISKILKLAEAQGLQPYLKTINIGAGLPSPDHGNNWSGYQSFFDVVRMFRFRNANGSIIPFAAEPGRALVAPCEALLVPINQIDEASGRLVLSQSMAGGLHHIAKLPEVAPLICAVAGDGRAFNDGIKHWRCTGGSPAGFEVGYSKSIELPSSLQAGDYVLVLMQGAYGRSLSSSFNGMSPPYIVDVGLSDKGSVHVSSIRRTDGLSLPSFRNVQNKKIKAYRLMAATA